MKKFVLLAAFALLAIAAPAAAESSATAQADPTVTLEQITGQPAPVQMINPPPPYCWQVQGTSCTVVGAKRACTDVCNNNLSCTCTYYYSNPSVRFWNCQYEC